MNMEKLTAARVAMAAERHRELRAALAKFGFHARDCSTWQARGPLPVGGIKPDDADCDCGLRLALALPDDGPEPVVIDEMHVWSPGWETKVREELERIAATTSSPATAVRLRALAALPDDGREGLDPEIREVLLHTWRGHIDCDPKECTVAHMARNPALALEARDE